MKKINILLVMAFVLLCSSCNDWLTVNPKAVSTEEKMFSSELGYTSALVGLYLDLQNIYTPSDFMMGGDLEYMAGNYMVSVSLTSDAYLYSIHKYTSSTIDSEIGTVFLNYYNVIANANVLLNALDGQKVLSKDEADLIKGEALAIRAYCQFELLRLWGPSPTQASATYKYLPYVTIYSSDDYKYITYSAYVDSLKSDFTNSRTLLSNVDPILKYSNSSLNSSYLSISAYNSLFWYNRQTRFNYYGVEALMARLYLWINDNDDAYKMAKDVISATNSDGTNKFTLGKQSDVSNSDYLLFNEHLVGLKISNWIDQYGRFSGRYAGYVNTNSNIYGKLFENQTDMRLNLFGNSYSYAWGQYVYGTMKFNKFSSSYSTPHSIPLIRLSEMYLIMMETAPIDEANTYYKAYRAARSASYTPMTESTRMSNVIKEYVREFFSEEQSFFAYKRLNSSSILLSGQSVTANGYVLPLPTGETGDYK